MRVPELTRITNGVARMHSPSLSSKRRTKGSTLLEVLVSIVVLSIGLLGLAGLQATSIKSNHSAYSRSQATLLAYDLADRMRSARNASTPQVGTGRFDDASVHIDRTSWNVDLVNLLGPGAVGTVVRNNNAVTITIQWDDNRGRIRQSGAANAALQSFVYQTEI